MEELLDLWFDRTIMGGFVMICCYLMLRYVPKIVRAHTNFINGLEERDVAQSLLLEDHTTSHGKIIHYTKKTSLSVSDYAEYMMMKLEKDSGIEESDRNGVSGRIRQRVCNPHGKDD